MGRDSFTIAPFIKYLFGVYLSQHSIEDRMVGHNVVRCRRGSKGVGKLEKFRGRKRPEEGSLRCS